jgi:predicted aldo/keto reductase-like oxidoreductase
MDGSHGVCGGQGNRRHFLKTAATAGVGTALASSEPAWGAEPPAALKSAIPTVTLGKTGEKVTILGQGSSWAVSPSFLQASIRSGVRYIDTSETYENTKSEKVIGEVLERMNVRKDVYVVTKINNYRTAKGDAARQVFAGRLNASLERLKTDYVDCYYIHGISGEEIGMLRDPGVKAAFEALKKQKKIRFCGLSCHDALLPEILELAAEVGWLDQVMFKYNFRDVGKKDRYDDLNRAIDKASKANLGMIAMKTQGGAINFPEKMAELQAKGFKKEVAAIKTVWNDSRMHVVVSEMTTRSDLRENVGGSQDTKVSAIDAKRLEEYRVRTANLYCHGCGHLCETAAKGVPVATVLRYLRYYEVYGKRQEARALYQALPPQARDLASADLDAAQAACPHSLPVVDLIKRADHRMS